MANYGLATTIPYGTDMFEVTGVEFCQWEDALEKCPDGDTTAMQWATYDVLMDNGYMVSQPTSERPVVEAGGGGGGGMSRKPGHSKHRINDGFDAVNNYVTSDTREPIWTQSRILTERDKLLRDREKIATLKEKALDQRILEQRLLERVKAEPVDYTGYMYFVVGAVLIGFVLMGILIVFLSIVLK